VHAFDVPGGHASMLQEPQVERVAQMLQLGIDKALAPKS
jgi:thioesterase domain-containing protein